MRSLHLSGLRGEAGRADKRYGVFNLLFLFSHVYPLAIFIPGRAGPFVTQLSEKLAAFAPQLTLDFIQEVTANMSKSSVAQRISCLQYMSPWVKNLSKFTEPTSPLYEQSGARLRDCVRVLIDLTMADQEVRDLMLLKSKAQLFCRFTPSARSTYGPRLGSWTAILSIPSLTNSSALP